MRKITLRSFAEEVGQLKAASQLGVRQSAISKAIRNGRNVVVTISVDGKITAEEIKSFPCNRRDDSCVSAS
ncbi:Cro/CI family transcriptional regulator [Kluyvera intermedia]|uniref:Cro/CI family transcriptional regulator n=1 Tax=Kluyvera intermedia TaxID=61648 RepID=UPI00370BB783